MRRHSKSDLAVLSADLSAPLPAPKKRSREESIMQCSLIRWWQLNCRHFGVPEILLTSCPNGGGRSGPKVGAILKAEGLRAGFPDLGLYVSRGDYHALFLELKRREGVVSPEQEVFHELLAAQGYSVHVTRTLADAINKITHYLAVKPQRTYIPPIVNVGPGGDLSGLTR